MYTTVVEHDGKLMYAALGKGGQVLAIFSDKVIELCDECLQRECCCFIKTAADALSRVGLCAICLDRKTGAI
jgi:hypothetical protein